MAAFVALIVTGASWAMAYSSVGTLLGAPPPHMGTQHTSIQWHGLSRLREEPPVWRFAFGPTRIPGAESVRIYVNPLGKVAQHHQRRVPAPAAGLCQGDRQSRRRACDPGRHQRRDRADLRRMGRRRPAANRRRLADHQGSRVGQSFHRYAPRRTARFLRPYLDQRRARFRHGTAQSEQCQSRAPGDRCFRRRHKQCRPLARQFAHRGAGASHADDRHAFPSRPYRARRLDVRPSRRAAMDDARRVADRADAGRRRAGRNARARSATIATPRAGRPSRSRSRRSMAGPISGGSCGRCRCRTAG